MSKTLTSLLKMHSLIQVAGIIDATEAQMLIDCGVHYLGFPLRLAVHQEDLSEEAAAAIIRSLQPPTCGVLITYLDQAQEIASLCQNLGALTVQLHGEVTTETLAQLKALAPELQIIKSLIVHENNLAGLTALVGELAPYVDTFITDTCDPATGRRGADPLPRRWSRPRRYYGYRVRYRAAVGRGPDSEEVFMSLEGVVMVTIYET